MFRVVATLLGGVALGLSATPQGRQILGKAGAFMAKRSGIMNGKLIQTAAHAYGMYKEMEHASPSEGMPRHTGEEDGPVSQEP